jgi:hypothetical protein
MYTLRTADAVIAELPPAVLIWVGFADFGQEFEIYERYYYTILFWYGACDKIITEGMNEKTEMMADMIKKLACLLIEQNDKLTLEQALATVFNSEIYGKVMNERTSFYTQSPRYVFSFLDEELKKGKLG